jgi:hypothetical protein
MPRALHKRFADALPRHGDRSKAVARMIEMWLDGQIMLHNVKLFDQRDELAVRSTP